MHPRFSIEGFQTKSKEEEEGTTVFGENFLHNYHKLRYLQFLSVVFFIRFVFYTIPFHLFNLFFADT